MFLLDYILDNSHREQNMNIRVATVISGYGLRSEVIQNFLP